LRALFETVYVLFNIVKFIERGGRERERERERERGVRERKKTLPFKN